MEHKPHWRPLEAGLARLSERIRTVQSELLAVQGDIDHLRDAANSEAGTKRKAHDAPSGQEVVVATVAASPLSEKAKEGERRATARRDPELLAWYQVLDTAICSWPGVHKYYRTTYMAYYYRGTALGGIYLAARKKQVRTWTKGEIKDIRRILQGTSVKPKDLTGQKHQGVGDIENEWQPGRDDVNKAIQVFQLAYDDVKNAEGGTP